MDFSLSSTGLENVDANQITSDNASIFSSLYVSGVNVLASINNTNSYIGPSNSSLNITGTTKITFNAGGLASTYVDSSGVNIFHTGMTVFPFSYDGYYNIRERLDNLRHVFLDAADPMIKYDADHNTVIKINEANILNPGDPSKNYPKRIIFKDFLNNVPAYINTSGVNILDANGNYNNINTYFTETGGSNLLIFSKKNMVDGNGDLNVFNMTSTTILGTTYTGGTWLKVGDTLNNSISGLSSLTTSVSSLNTSVSNLLAQLTTISGNAANIANIANYYSGLQSSLAVVNGVLSSTGLILAFDLKENRFDTKYPLNKISPVNGTAFNTLELNYNNTLTVDSSNKLSINTAGFLTSPESDLGLVANASGQTTVVLKNISQSITCQSSLNVSGNFTCNLFTALNATIPSILLTTSSTTFNIPSSTLPSILLTSSSTIFNTPSSTIPSILLTTSSTTFNTPNSTLPSILLTTSSTTFNIPNSTNQSILLTTSGTIFNSNITVGNTLNVVGSIFGNNINTQKSFNIIVNTICQIGSTQYYRYDLDLNKYTTFITIGTTTTTRKFKFMCWVSSGAHNSGLYSLNYDIDYSFCQNLSNYNGLNALAYGFPYDNYNLNQITPNGLFIWKYTFDYMTIFSKNQINLQCIIIDYLN